MKVYIVFNDMGYDGTVIISIHTTPEGAENARLEAEKKDQMVDSEWRYIVEEFEVQQNESITLSTRSRS